MDWKRVENARDAKWENMYSQTAEFIKHNGRLPVQSEGVLGKWVSHQREFYRKGNSLSTARIERLEKLSGWTWNPPRGGAARQTQATSAAPPR